MTRLKAFAAALTEEMLHIYEHGQVASGEPDSAAAVAEHRIREFALECTDDNLGNTVRAGEWLDEEAS